MRSRVYTYLATYHPLGQYYMYTYKKLVCKRLGLGKYIPWAHAYSEKLPGKLRMWFKELVSEPCSSLRHLASAVCAQQQRQSGGMVWQSQYSPAFATRGPPHATCRFHSFAGRTAATRLPSAHHPRSSLHFRALARYQHQNLGRQTFWGLAFLEARRRAGRFAKRGINSSQPFNTKFKITPNVTIVRWKGYGRLLDPEFYIYSAKKDFFLIFSPPGLKIYTWSTNAAYINWFEIKSKNCYPQ